MGNDKMTPANKTVRDKGAVPKAVPMKSVRQNPVKAQMSRQDSLSSVGEFGKVLTVAEQAKARAVMQNSKKPGPLHQLLNVFNFAGNEKR